MLRDVENMQDFLQYYGRRYLKGRNGTDIYWCLHQPRTAVMPRDSTGFIHSTKDGEWTKVTVPFNEFDDRFLFGLPPLGVVVVGCELLYLSYTPVRQGSRGLDPSRIVVHSFNCYDINKNKHKPFSLDELHEFETSSNKIRSILFPVRYTLKEALALYGKENIAFSLGRWWGLVGTTNGEYPTLTFMDREVGHVDPNTGSISFTCSVAEGIWRRHEHR